MCFWQIPPRQHSPLLVAARQHISGIWNRTHKTMYEYMYVQHKNKNMFLCFMFLSNTLILMISAYAFGMIWVTPGYSLLLRLDSFYSRWGMESHSLILNEFYAAAGVHVFHAATFGIYEIILHDSMQQQSASQVNPISYECSRLYWWMHLLMQFGEIWANNMQHNDMNYAT